MIQQVLATMKSRDTEGPFELYATRTPGYLFALLFRWLRVHPIAVTLISMVIGCASGYFFFHIGNILYNVIGIAMLLIANWLDCADGQLARMTGKKTQIGRVLDGFAGDLWFFSIYHCIMLGLCTMPMPGLDYQWGIWIWLMGYFSGLYAHAGQARLADYYRNAHLYFIGAGNDLDSAARIHEEYSGLKWRSGSWFHKLYLFFYHAYTKAQEKSTPEFQKLYALVRQKYGNDLPDSLRQAFRAQSKPLMPLCQILTFDARVGVMFVCLLTGQPWLFFVMEITAFELLRLYTRRRHERLCRQLSASLDSFA